MFLASLGLHTVDPHGAVAFTLPCPPVVVGSINGVRNDERGGGVCGILPPAVIGGWHLQAQNCAYDGNGTSRFTGQVGRVALPPLEGAAAKLWAAVTDELGSTITMVHSESFDPATLPEGGPGVEITCVYTLPDGHTLRLRVFAVDPATVDLATGVPLWEL